MKERPISQGLKYASIGLTALSLALLAACGKQAEPQVDRVAAEAKAKLEAEAKAVEAAAKEAEPRTTDTRPNSPPEAARWICARLHLGYRRPALGGSRDRGREVVHL